MIGIQVFAVFFSLFMAYIAYINFRKKIISGLAFVLWEALWVGFIVVVLFPSIMDPILEVLHFYRLFDMLTVAAFAFLVVFSFYNFILASRNNKKIEKLVRRIAIGGEQDPSSSSTREKDKKASKKKN
jgi:hypothetical protein